MKFRKKPVEVEAIQLTDSPQSLSDVLEFIGDSRKAFGDWDGKESHCVKIETLEGTMTATEGDWIIRGVKGECYPCKPDIFEATYEKVEEQ